MSKRALAIMLTSLILIGAVAIYIGGGPSDSDEVLDLGRDTDEGGIGDYIEELYGMDLNDASDDEELLENHRKYGFGKYGLDSDGDYVSDDLEKVIGSDPNILDTDGGGVDDFNEVYTYGLNPDDPADDSELIERIPDVEVRRWIFYMGSLVDGNVSRSPEFPGLNGSLQTHWEKSIVISLRDPLVRWLAERTEIRWEADSRKEGTLYTDGELTWAGYGAEAWSDQPSYYFAHGREGSCIETALAVNVVLGLMGYKCMVVSGTFPHPVSGVKDAAHVWNEAYIDGEVYVVSYGDVFLRREFSYEENGWQVMSADYDPDWYITCCKLDAAASFLRDRFDPLLRLVCEAPNVAPDVFWLVGDNLLAQHVLSQFPYVCYHGDVAEKIRNRLVELAGFYGLPTDDNGLPISHKHDAALGLKVALPFNQTNFYVLGIEEGHTMKTEVLNKTERMEDWDQYIDTLCYAALTRFYENKTDEAKHYFSMAADMWDGVGLADKGFWWNNSLSRGKYETYKLALLLFTSKTLNITLDYEDELCRRIWTCQADNGGIITHYLPNGKPDGDANSETTAFVLLARPNAAKGEPGVHFNIIKGGDLVDRDQWLPHGNATITDGKAYLNITERQGTPSIYAGIQQGVYPHGWNRKGRIQEIMVNQSIEDNSLFIRIVATRSEFEFYNETESIVNIGIMIWIQLGEDYHEPIDQSKQLELDISLTGYVYTLNQESFCYNNGEPMLITWDTEFEGDGSLDRDYHYIAIPKEGQLMTDSGEKYEVIIDAGWCIGKALRHWGIEQGRPRSFTPFIEAKYGSGSVTFEEFEFYFE